MVADAFVNVGAWVVSHVLAVITLPVVPAWITGAPASIEALGSYLTGVGAWIPWPVVAAVFGTWVVVLAASVLLKLLRIAFAFVPFIGGSTS